jgi:hypothetical protein
LIGPTYHASNIRRYEAAVAKVLDRVIARLRTLDEAEVDLKEWMHIIVVECLGEVVLTWSPGLLKGGSDGGSGVHAYLGWRQKSVFGIFPTVAILRSVFPSLGWYFSGACGISFRSPENFKPFFTVRSLQCTWTRTKADEAV